MIPYSTFTLDNGLRVVHNYDAQTAMVGINIIYNVGARDEEPDVTGIAHLFEHLMFGGSVNIPKFDAAIERAGGQNNAWTSNDYTSFWDTAPAHNVEILFWLESDRMLSPAFSQKALNVQKHVVIEEFKQTCLNKPYGDLAHSLRRMLYKTHPYAWPVIGKEPSHIENVSLDYLRDFFFSHYAPNNAVLAVSGKITLDQTRHLAEKWFGPIPRRKIKPRTYAPEAPIEATRCETIYGRVPQTMIVIAFPMPGLHSPHYISCDLLTDILASGRSSRLYRRLVLTGTHFSEADASIAGCEEPGWLMLTGKPLSESPDAIDQAKAILMEQALELTRNTVDNKELLCAQNRFDSNLTFGAINYLSKAQTLATSIMQDIDPNSLVDKYRSATPQALLEAAQMVIDPQRCVTLTYSPLPD